MLPAKMWVKKTFAASGIAGSTGGSGGHGGNGIGGPGGNGGNGGNAGNGLGGGLFVSGATLTIYNSTIADNAVAAIGLGGGRGLGAPGFPGGLNGLAGSNGVADGGGMFIGTASTVTFFNVTVALNSTGVYQVGGNATMYNSIFADNGYTWPLGFVGADYENVGPTAYAYYSLFGTVPIGVVTDPTNLVLLYNPGLSPAGLANNGGPTLTIALESDSKAIGTGKNPIERSPPHH